MTSWESYLEDNQARFLDELMAFIRIPSVSALPEHAADVQQAGEWLAQKLRDIGIENVEVMPTGGHPVVYGDWLHAEGKPTILIYGHFDVQPADPFELWDSPPFEPVVKDGRVYARGASDDKGSLYTSVLGVEALLQSEGKLPVNIKFCYEGQEEIGSPQLPEFLATHREKFACDLVLTADGLQWTSEQPALLTGLKGLCGVQINVRGANNDLHSGLHGGVVQNPIEALGQIIASMRSADGSIAIEGFYDDVLPLSDRDKADIAAVPFNEKDYLAALDVDATIGETDYSIRERNWARPTLDFNGIWSGFQGEGTKTVIPNEAHAKITCRLVANQDPDKIVELIQAHVVAHKPLGVNVEIVRLPGSSIPYLMAADHPGNQIAHDVLKELYGRDPYYVRLGGSIPICPLFLKELGAYTVNFGFTLDDENLHAPNEFFRLANFEIGQKGYCKLLKRLAAYR